MIGDVTDGRGDQGEKLSAFKPRLATGLFSESVPSDDTNSDVEMFTESAESVSDLRPVSVSLWKTCNRLIHSSLNGLDAIPTGRHPNRILGHAMATLSRCLIVCHRAKDRPFAAATAAPPAS